ncbi:purE [Wigglesworthia glossinidia endosymbiont of Glossina brevipalpis]|uniref:N5-carboxyaminoimidazole ribonucleotide mutase n=1 Tax=Wigglesworthia glossinidia brevipalpis TaxID=36870 RepID=Q8D2V7_WIGBR|nr:purE [Wigglesworthia glossinidia endosymbiont of Glossina brevipalpis]
MNKNNKVAIIMGSKSDWNTLKHASNALKDLKIKFTTHIISAHRTPDKLFEFAEQAKKNGYCVIIAGAGGAAHLPGMLASKTLIPVLGVPVENSPLNGLDSLYSIVQMPSEVPVGTLAIGKSGAINSAILASQILSLNDYELYIRLKLRRKEKENQILNYENSIL